MVQRLLGKKPVICFLVTLMLLAVIFITHAIGVDGPKVKELTLQEAVYLAAQNNPDIELAKLAVQKADIEYYGALSVADKMDTSYITNYQTGAIKWISPKATEVAFVLAKKGNELADKRVRLNVENAYYNVLKAQKNLNIKREGLKYFQDQLKIAQTGFKVGTKAKLDLTTAEAAVAGYQAQVASEENNLRVTVMELNKLIGLDLDTPLKLTTKFNMEKVGDTIKIDETIKKALVDNYEILSVKKNQELKKVQFETAQKFYGGGVTTYDTAVIDQKSAEASVRKQETATTMAVKQSYLTLFTLEKMIDWQTKEVEKSREIARVYLLKYKTGMATSIEVRKANLDLQQAEASLAETIYKYNIIKAQFKYELFSSATSTTM
jgi:outer membrane protein